MKKYLFILGFCAITYAMDDEQQPIAPQPMRMREFEASITETEREIILYQFLYDIEEKQFEDFQQHLIDYPLTQLEMGYLGTYIVKTAQIETVKSYPSLWDKEISKEDWKKKNRDNIHFYTQYIDELEKYETPKQLPAQDQAMIEEEGEMITNVVFGALNFMTAWQEKNK